MKPSILSKLSLPVAFVWDYVDKTGTLNSKEVREGLRYVISLPYSKTNSKFREKMKFYNFCRVSLAEEKKKYARDLEKGIEANPFLENLMNEMEAIQRVRALFINLIRCSRIFCQLTIAYATTKALHKYELIPEKIVSCFVENTDPLPS